MCLMLSNNKQVSPHKPLIWSEEPQHINASSQYSYSPATGFYLITSGAELETPEKRRKASPDLKWSVPEDIVICI